MKLETPRTILRDLEAGDFEALFRLTGDADSLKYMGDGKPLTAETTRRWIAVSQENYAKLGYGALAVVDKASGLFAGIAGFIRSEDATPPDEGELIYALLPEYRGKGLATEISAALVEYGFRRLGFERVLATIDPANAPSVRVAEKLGFVLRETKPDEHGMETLFFWREHEP